MKLFDFDKLIKTLSGYIETKIELLKLDVQDTLNSILGKLIILAIILILALLGLIFISFGVAVTLNNYLDSRFWGFILVGTVYLALGAILVYTQRTRIKLGFTACPNEDLKEQNPE